jgi:hypothetical protein
MIEHGKMFMKPKVWVIQCLQEFSTLFVRPQKDEDEQGLLSEGVILKSRSTMQHLECKSLKDKFHNSIFGVDKIYFSDIDKLDSFHLLAMRR